MENKVNNPPYRTSDTPIAAYLESLGYVITEIIYDNHRAFFIFEDVDDKFFRYIHEFEMGQAVGNISDYEESRHNLVKRVKRGLP